VREVERGRSTGRPPDRPGNSAIWGLLGLALVLRVVNAWKSYNIDEIYTLQYSGPPFSRLFDYIATHDTHPPLYYVLIHFWRLVSSAELWVRMPNILLGVGTCYVTYLIAAQFVSRRGAIMALFLAATAPTLVWVSQEARNYALMGFSAGLSTYFMIKILHAPKSKYWIGYVLAAAAGVYSFYYGALVIIAQNLAFLLSFPKGWKTVRNWMVAQAAVLLLFLPWLPSFMTQASVVHTDVTSNRPLPVKDVAVLWNSVVTSVEPLAVTQLLLRVRPIMVFHVVSSLLTVAAVLAIAYAVWRKKRSTGVWGLRDGWPYVFLITLVAAVGLEALAFRMALNVFFSTRYFCFLSIFGSVLAAMLLGGVRPRLAWGIIVILLAVQIPRFGRLYAVTEDWRGVSDFLEARVTPDDYVAIISYHSAPCIRHYAGKALKVHGLPFDVPGVRREPAGLDFVQAVRPGDMPAIGKELRKHKETWMVWSHVKRGPVDRGERLMKAWFAGNGYVVVRASQFPGIQVEQYSNAH